MDRRQRRRRWWVKHHKQCNKLRLMARVNEGDGLKHLSELERGNAVERELAATYKRIAREAFWSVDFFDTTIAMYASIRDRAMRLRHE